MNAAPHQFHPLIQQWFDSKFDGPTEPQLLGWPSIAAGDHTLIAAPTGSGKTLTAFLACIDQLVRRGLRDGELPNELHVVYVSPLRALSNDMHRNLEEPLHEISKLATDVGCPLPKIRVGLRTGDTSPSQRAAITRKPPHILVTTPESLYLLLTAGKGREALRTTSTVIVDEIHALVRDKRGSHLALSLERLASLVDARVQRIGLSATQKPIERVAKFLIGVPNVRAAVVSGAGNPHSDSSVNTERSATCRIIDVGHQRELDLAIETPPSELGAVCTHEQWAEVNQRMVDLVQSHRSTLIFVNTRRMAERLTHQLTELLGEDAVGAHHGSLSAKIRLDTERRLKSGDLRAVVATASLELGLDVGFIDLVIQIGSPRSIATFLQRIGRSGHSLGLIPKGRLFALTRDELLELMAIIRAVELGQLDTVRIPDAPLDILAQQIVAEVSGQDWAVDELFDVYRRAWPYRNLSRQDFDRTIEYLSEGIPRADGRSRAWLHFDRVGRRLTARKGARITATSNGGAIGDVGSFRVVADPEGTVVGTLDEDFAVESNRGDIFLLGNTSWRILHVRGGDVTVADAGGAPPTVPFWRGEAPGRSRELSTVFSDLREELAQRVIDPAETITWLREHTHCSDAAAEQIVRYVAAQKAAIGVVPTQRNVVFERFFDETGGMQLVVHAPFGGDIVRAWAFAIRKRFCRSFDFELQATGADNGFILSLGPQHSFPIESLFPMLRPDNSRGLLEQAVLTTPMFQLRWRWNVTRALQVDRMRNGRKVPPHLQRFRSDDLLTAVFPKLTGCQEEHTGDHEIPDHPLTRQTMHDCLHEALDLHGLNEVLSDAQAGNITFIARDTREPSPFSYELLNSNPYAFLDGGEIQERRARAVATRRSLTVESVNDLGRLDPDAIAQVRSEATPLVRNADELHDVLLSRFLLFNDRLEPDWRRWLDELVGAGRVTRLTITNGRDAWTAAERLPAVRVVFPAAKCHPELEVPCGVRVDWDTVEARVAMVRGWLEICGPCTVQSVACELNLTESQTFATLEALEAEGVVMRGRFEQSAGRGDASLGDAVSSDAARDTSAESSADDPAVEWCHRRLLARIHRLTMQGLRAEIEPVDVATFVQFLVRHHRLHPTTQSSGPNAVFDVIAMLQGLDMPAVCWDRDLLAGRIADYRPQWLDELCLTGDVGWGRLFPPKRDPHRSRPMVGITRVAPISLWLRADLDWLTAFSPPLACDGLSSPAEEILELLRAGGAMFAADLIRETRMLPGQLDDVLGELVSRGFVTADGVGGLRQLIRDRSHDNGTRSRRGLIRTRQSLSSAGRWSVWRDATSDATSDANESTDHRSAAVEQWAWQLLRRWGVMFRDLLDRESGGPSWYELLQVYRRLEARGEIRGGRFVSGVAGEQFASGEVVRNLRQLRQTTHQPAAGTTGTADGCDELLVVSAGDPLNLVGILSNMPRVPATASNRIIIHNGRFVAAMQSGNLVALADLPESLTDRIRCRLALDISGPVAIVESDDERAEAHDATVAGTEESTDSTSSTGGRKRRKRQSGQRGIPRPLIR